MKHALLSASSADRWLACTPSARIEEKLEGTFSVNAEEGTKAHAVAEYFNRAIFDDDLDEAVEKALQNPEYTEEMIDHALHFSLHIFEIYKNYERDGDMPIVLFEEKLDFSEYAPEGFGTGDVVILTKNKIHIIDYKYGKGVFVEAENNNQLKLYALGAYEMYKFLYDFTSVTVEIYQPRIHNVKSCDISLNNLLYWAENVIKPLALKAYIGAGELSPGEHCRFCKTKASCKARASHFLELETLMQKSPNSLSIKETEEILQKGEGLTAWFNSVSELAYKKALEGVKFTGFKLVKKRSLRRFKDTEKVIDTLYKKGLKQEDIFDLKLKSITNIENLLEKEDYKEFEEEFTEKPDSGLTLAPYSDRRKEYSLAESDFEDIKIEELIKN